MAVNKIINATQLDANLSSIANAIREKNDTNTQLSFPNGFVNAIENISSGNEIPFTLGKITIINSTGISYSAVVCSISIDSNFGYIFNYINIANGEQADIYYPLQKYTPAYYENKDPVLYISSSVPIGISFGGPGILNGTLVATKIAGAAHITAINVLKRSYGSYAITFSSGPSPFAEGSPAEMTIELTVE